MATYTPNINLKKPIKPENFSTDDLNANSDKIDEAMGLRAIASDVNVSLGTKTSKLMTTNVINNGDFTSGSGWYRPGGTVTVADNVASITAPSDTLWGAVGIYGGCPVTPSNHKIYLKSNVKTDSPDSLSLQITAWDSAWGGAGTFPIITSPTQNEWYVCSTIIFAPNGIANFAFESVFASNVTAANTTTSLEKVIAIDLTDLFGVGKEPTLEQFEAWLILLYPTLFFNGTVEFTTIKQLFNEKADKTRWYGKNVLCIGDSLTVANQWQLKLTSILGLVVTNHALGGVGLVQMIDGTTSEIGTLAPLDSTIVSGKDLIILFGGYNDRGIAEGVIGDLYPTQDTLAGRLQYAINGIYALLLTANNNGCRVVVVTPHCAGKYEYITYDGYTEYPTGSGRTMKTMAAKMEEIANHNSVPCYNAWLNSGISKFNWNYFSASATPMTGETVNDQLHLNTTYGYPFLGTRIAGFVETI